MHYSQTPRPNPQRGSALVAVLSLTTAVALIVTTRLFVATETLRMDQNSQLTVISHLTSESRLRQVEWELATGALQTPPQDRTGAAFIHAWIEPTSPDGVMVEYLGCARLEDIPLALCEHANTQGLAAHRYRLSVRLNTGDGLTHLQSLYHTHQRYENDIGANNQANTTEAVTAASGPVVADTRELIPVGRVSWIAY